MKQITKQRGFTLVELLVAVTIFVSLMAGITLLFTSSVRTVKQSEQARAAFDMARGALHIQEEDLISAFSARDRGDVRKFYGTPVGMVFIGVVKDSDGNTQLARITYVVHQSPLVPARTIELPPDDPASEEAKQVNVYSLLRYVELGVEDIDSFPVDWEQTEVAPDSGDIRSLTDYIDDTLALTTQSVLNLWDNPLCDPNDASCRATMELTLKRRIWIQLLSGEIPGFWKTDPNDTSETKPDPRDYVLLENVVSAYPPTLGIIDANGQSFIGFGGEVDPESNKQDKKKVTIVPYQQSSYRDTNGKTKTETVYTEIYPDCFFQYGAAKDYTGKDADGNAIRMTIDWSPYWHGLENATAQVMSNNVLGSPLLPRSPELVRCQFELNFESPYPGAPPFVRRFDQEVDVRTGYTRASFREP